MYFFHPFCLLAKIIGKRIEPRKDCNHCVLFFSLNLLCKKDTYNVNHCVVDPKKIHCWALYCNCVKPDTTMPHLTH